MSTMCLTKEKYNEYHPTDTGEEFKDWPIAYSDSLIAAWEDDKTATMAITIDDNQGQDVPWWTTRGIDLSLNFTWVLITNNVSDIKTTAKGGYWDQYRGLYALGHDLQSHTLSHLADYDAGTATLEEEYGDSLLKIESEIGNAVEVLAYPGGYDPDINDHTLAMTYYLGARGIVNHINNKSFDTTDAYGISGQVSIQDPSKDWIYADRMYDHTDEKFRGFVCMYFHDISFGTPEQIASKLSLAISTTKYMDDNRRNLWMGSFKNITKYAKERDAVESESGLTVTSSTTEEIQLGLTMNSTLSVKHNYPLTVKTKVATDWGDVSATQNGVSVESYIKEYNSEKYVYIKVIPDNGSIVISRII